VSSTDVPEESSRRSVQQLENSVGRAQFWCEEPACRGVQQNGGVPDKRCQKPACRRAWSMLGQCHGPRIQSKAVTATLYSIRWRTGSQWSTSGRTGVMCWTFPAPTTNRAAAFKTICNRRITVSSSDSSVTDAAVAVCQTPALWQNGRKICPDFIPYERRFSPVFWEEEWLVEVHFWLNFWVNRPPLERNRRFSTDIRS